MKSLYFFVFGIALAIANTAVALDDLDYLKSRHAEETTKLAALKLKESELLEVIARLSDERKLSKKPSQEQVIWDKLKTQIPEYEAIKGRIIKVEQELQRIETEMVAMGYDPLSAKDDSKKNNTLYPFDPAVRLQAILGGQGFFQRNSRSFAESAGIQLHYHTRILP